MKCNGIYSAERNTRTHPFTLVADVYKLVGGFCSPKQRVACGTNLSATPTFAYIYFV